MLKPYLGLGVTGKIFIRAISDILPCTLIWGLQLGLGLS